MSPISRSGRAIIMFKLTWIMHHEVEFYACVVTGVLFKSAHDCPFDLRTILNFGSSPGDRGVRSKAAGLLRHAAVLRGPEAAGGRPVRSPRSPGERDGQ